MRSINSANNLQLWPRDAKGRSKGSRQWAGGNKQLATSPAFCLRFAVLAEREQMTAAELQPAPKAHTTQDKARCGELVQSLNRARARRRITTRGRSCPSRSNLHRSQPPTAQFRHTAVLQ